jgi:hypothetical protein
MPFSIVGLEAQTKSLSAKRAHMRPLLHFALYSMLPEKLLAACSLVGSGLFYIEESWCTHERSCY